MAPLYRLSIFGTPKKVKLSRRGVATVVDALSSSGLPFLEFWPYITERKMDSPIQAQLQRNQRMWRLGDLERVPASSMRLFINFVEIHMQVLYLLLRRLEGVM